jgi:N-acetylglutamate synthase-like GNAT family acetyltransferase
MFTNYALTDMTAGVIAAASVIHGHGDSTNTYISEIAVAPEQQGEGYGGDLLRFIAQQALAHGNDQLSAVPLAPGFFRHFGFRQKQGAILTLAASAHDVLATRKG